MYHHSNWLLFCLWQVISLIKLGLMSLPYPLHIYIHAYVSKITYINRFNCTIWVQPVILAYRVMAFLLLGVFLVEQFEQGSTSLSKKYLPAVLAVLVTNAKRTNNMELVKKAFQAIENIITMAAFNGTYYGVTSWITWSLCCCYSYGAAWTNTLPTPVRYCWPSLAYRPQGVSCYQRPKADVNNPLQM